MRNARDIAVELVEEGGVSAETMLTACLQYMSTDDVLDMLQSNYFIDDTEDEEEDSEPDFPLSLEYDEGDY